ncbi:MAG TPA: hypothetical protein VN736_28800 [Candidatus Limnocylindrales bacterium]|nr:hypothetical protein [Candidatus Limnocylindrales bacterium]
MKRRASFEAFTDVELLKPWDGRSIGARLHLVRWLAVSLAVQGIALPVNPAEWSS